MLQMKAIVYHDRNYLGKLVIEKNGEKFDCCVSARSEDSLRIPNPPAGVYKLIKIADISKDAKALAACGEKAFAAYGSKIIYFEASGTKSQAGSKEKYVIALHGGDTDKNGNLLSTEGSLRVSNLDIGYVVNLLKQEKEVIFTIEEQKIGLMEMVFTKKVSRCGIPKIVMDRDTNQDNENALSSTFFWQWLLHRNIEESQHNIVVDDGIRDFLEAADEDILENFAENPSENQEDKGNESSATS